MDLRRLPINLCVLFTALVALWPATLRAMPSLSRAYGVACESCHTVYPKLNPFGEAFRRNGFRMPYAAERGVVVDETDDGWVTSALQSLSVGLVGEIAAYPDPNSLSAASGSPGHVSLAGLSDPVVLWAAARFGEHMTLVARVQPTDRLFAQATLYATELFGLGHAFNASLRYGAADLLSVAPNSSYINPSLLVAYDENLGWAGFSGTLLQSPVTASLFGVLAHRFMYHAGVGGTIGGDEDPSPYAYAHLGAKLGGVEMDGEGAAWEDSGLSEVAVTWDLFGVFRRGVDQGALDGVRTGGDDVWTGGTNLRSQHGALENNVGGFYEVHSELPDVLALYDEVAYAAVPTLVPALRLEYLENASVVDYPQTSLFRASAGLTWTMFDNVRASVSMNLLVLSGEPPSGWGDVYQAPPSSSQGSRFSFDKIAIGLEAAL